MDESKQLLLRVLSSLKILRKHADLGSVRAPLLVLFYVVLHSWWLCAVVSGDGGDGWWQARGGAAVSTHGI
jgi:hypothetical protein